MRSIDSAIARFRRDLTLSFTLKVALTAVIVGALVGGAFVPRLNGPLVVLGAMGVWIFLSYRSIRSSRLTALSPMLIASGQFDEAERQIDAALSSFSLFRTVKLLALHHLAMLRHAQHRWQDAAALCRVLLRQRLGAVRNLSRSARLMLADAMLELNDLAGAFEALRGLYTERLSLSEALNLLAVQSDYLARLGAWDQLLDKLPTKLQLAELMGSSNAARTQAFLALAAERTGKTELATFLRRRVRLLIDPEELSRHRPLLAELWSDRASDNP